MKIAISNIGWIAEYDQDMYGKLQKYGFDGLEIAPTRIFPEQPYEHLQEAAGFAKKLQDTYGLSIPSMQSIWFGQNDNLFAGETERQRLINYTKQAMLFAETIGCENLVFGCPRNRNMPDILIKDDKQKYYEVAVNFFRELAEFATEHHTVLAMEANPPIYHTNFINTTLEAYQIVRDVDHAGFKINLDIGTMIQNEEDVRSTQLEKIMSYVNHIHISEPYLAPVENRKLHKEVFDVAEMCGYQRYMSIEMGKQDNMQILESCIQYVLEWAKR